MRAELHPHGLEVVTVGMDTAGAQACRPYIEAARPEHPSLIDVAHLMAERFGVTNVPNGIWIDERGVIVRPAEPAFPGVKPLPTGDPETMPQRMKDVLAEAAKIKADPAGYAAALRDWVARGVDSTFALPPEDVLARSGRGDLAAAEAAAHFSLAQHLYRAGRTDAAVRHFREVHRLAPGNISYKRQAWSLATPGAGAYERFLQGPQPGREDEWPYDSDWLTEIQAMGAENYYPPMR
jgi:hypothetical protein